MRQLNGETIRTFLVSIRRYRGFTVAADFL